ncbi:NUDIX hydrolase [Asticcacaulis sp. AND118]|uniref:NUDIX hydrolase n=1 Tax=Asticcacaulis sp. AND118 TaxID=2840468 RepID=UPI001CFFA816|nr:NUDIX hydrolase [Asticcacaulis sp. AND118]UDF02198.1 NUDIX hydrolase [Asticcacaulis sp. AND118]
MQAKIERPVPAVGVVCWRDDEVLLIRRGREPRKGHWSIPGGKVERFEALKETALRELREETGVTARLGPLIEVYEIIEPGTDAHPDGFHLVLIDYVAEWLSGEPVAADDADEARFVLYDEALTLLIEDDLKDVVTRSRGLRKSVT